MIRNLIVRVLIGLMVWMPAQFAAAGMIATDAGWKAAQTVDRSAVVSKLEAFGIDPLQAQDRVGAMSDDEVRALADGIETLPSGKESSAAIAIIVIVALLLWWNIRKR